MGEVRLHDTRSGAVLALEPRDPGRVGIYACGPTVYSRIHVGNARPFVVFSVLKRFLEHEGYEVKLAMNITDVNDKIYAAAGESGRGSAQLAEEMAAAYVADTDALGLGRPDAEPLASQSMDAIVAYIEALVAGGHAYERDGDVYFRVRSDEAYGSLSHRQVDEMDQGEDVEGSDRKDDPLDFALWKAQKPGEDTHWPSPWGPGRPGWHIECSAMAEEALGVGFDIHGGGSDLVFPHHENEAAQTRAARGGELARLWMHNGMVQMTGEKMAKSEGRVALLHELLERHGAHTVVLYLLSGHYRQPLAYSEETLLDAELRVARLREALRRLTPGAPSPPDMAAHAEEFFAALGEDFNTPRALAALFEWVREANRRSAESASAAVGDGDLREMLGVLGLTGLQQLEAHGDVSGMDPRAAELVERREQARAARDFALADELRAEIENLGWDVRDGADGPSLVPRQG
ncbi:MAG: cysteine--tRNA ligase [Solirubrobacteraceae bacterium]